MLNLSWRVFGAVDGRVRMSPPQAGDEGGAKDEDSGVCPPAYLVRRVPTQGLECGHDARAVESPCPHECHLVTVNT